MWAIFSGGPVVSTKHGEGYAPKQKPRRCKFKSCLVQLLHFTVNGARQVSSLAGKQAHLRRQSAASGQCPENDVPTGPARLRFGSREHGDRHAVAGNISSGKSACRSLKCKSRISKQLADDASADGQSGSHVLPQVMCAASVPDFAAAMDGSRLTFGLRPMCGIGAKGSLFIRSAFCLKDGSPQSRKHEGWRRQIRKACTANISHRKKIEKQLHL